MPALMPTALLVLATCGAALATDTRVSLETDSWMQRSSLPKGTSVVGESDPLELLELVFFVKQQNLDKLEQAVMDVSDPDSPTWGHHLTNEDVHALVAPLKSDVEVVKRWLASSGVSPILSLTPNSDAIAAHVTVDQANALLNCTYLEVALHGVDGDLASAPTVHRTVDGYSLPAVVAAAVDFVTPTVHVPPAHRPMKRTVEVTKPEIGNSPKHLRELYSVGDALGVAPSNKMAVTAFLGQKYSEADLKEFWAMFCGGITCGKGVPALKGDATTGIFSGIESMLDIETITGVAGNISSEFWGFSGKSPDNRNNEPFMKWLTMMSGTDDKDVPKVFSTSYGEDEKSWSMAAASRMNVEFQKAGARGISLLYASGDEGANCEDGNKFEAETPSSSPWVTAVGGTTGSDKESAAGLSSGGFSSRWAQPSWQADAVHSYLTTAKDLPEQKSAGYNVSGRAYPDISAQATDFTVVSKLIPNPGVAGTSCASPTAAGVIALLNDARLAAGKPVLGFLNPWIYKNAGKWNDITSGSSSGCGFEADGWPASQGWDAVTGVGTPNFKQLAEAL